MRKKTTKEIASAHPATHSIAVRALLAGAVAAFFRLAGAPSVQNSIRGRTQSLPKSAPEEAGMRITSTVLLLLAVFLVALPLPARENSNESVVVFWEEGFPGADSAVPTRSELETLLPDAAYRSADELGVTLSEEKTKLLVLPFGSAFPEIAWGAIYDYLQRGGNLLVLGGRPFLRAAHREQAAWELRPPRIAYAKSLFINEYQPTPGSNELEAQQNENFTFLELPPFEWEKAFSLMIRLSAEDHYDRHGSMGTLDARLDALVWGVKNGRRLSAPLVQIDHWKNNFVGGRWIFLACELPENFYSSPTARPLLSRLAARARAGAEEFIVRPAWPVVQEAEPVELQLRWRRFRTAAAPARVELTLRPPQGPASRRAFTLQPGQFPYFDKLSLPPATQKGLHVVVARLYTGDRVRAIYRTGFWLRDEAFLRSGPRVAVNEGSFELDGHPLPVVGTTYMASDAQRQFFMRPNPYVWDKDFAELRRAGINMVRTGWWTGWDQIMKESGTIHEEMLRALEAFLLTARKHEIPVQFTFFSFIPEVLNGENPYLDPEALRRQKDLILSVVQRFKDIPYLIWDLINEPSFANPDRLWVTRPNWDSHEERAWNEWLASRYPDRGTLANQWNTPIKPEPALLPLPEEEDFSLRNVFQGRKPLKVYDYYRFAQVQFARWAKELREAIRATGSQQLVTVGQDEGGGRDRPSPAYFGDVVDFTTIHSWWLNDALLWDSLVSTVPGKPMLVQETGVMHREELDENPRRDSENKAALLERKVALALATGAGAIQWLWHVNAYMRDDNEVSIGAVRVDGTEKPEAEVLRRMAAFVAKAAEAFREPETPEVAIVISQAFQYSLLNHLAIEAQMKSVRALHYHCGVSGYVVAENRIAELGFPQLAILPSPQSLGETAWQHLLEYVERGGNLLITGPVEWDAHWQAAGRLESLGVVAELHPITYRAASLRLAQNTFTVSFGGDKQQFLYGLRFVDGSGVRQLSRGEGKIFWASLPVELAEGVTATAQLYQWILNQIGLEPSFESTSPLSPGVLVRSVRYEEAVLYLFLSESGQAENIDGRDKGTGAKFQFRLPAQRARLVLIRKKNGAVIAQYGF